MIHVACIRGGRCSFVTKGNSGWAAFASRFDNDDAWCAYGSEVSEDTHIVRNFTSSKAAVLTAMVASIVVGRDKF